ncbi:hypothetical protein [Ancylobacter radicis]|nr:hypothetical protein [Ancylobacter radicis]
MRPAFTCSQGLVIAALLRLVMPSLRAKVSRRDLMRRTGLGRTVVEDAMRLARQLGLTRESRHPTGACGNIVEIIHPAWRVWIEQNKGGFIAPSPALPPLAEGMFTVSQARVLSALVQMMPESLRAEVSRRELMHRTALGRTTVEDALRLARHRGVIRERRQSLPPGPNMIEIVDPAWRSWIGEHRR